MRMVSSELMRAAQNAPNDHRWLLSSPIFQCFYLVIRTWTSYSYWLLKFIFFLWFKCSVISMSGLIVAEPHCCGLVGHLGRRRAIEFATWLEGKASYCYIGVCSWKQRTDGFEHQQRCRRLRHEAFHFRRSTGEKTIFQNGFLHYLLEGSCRWKNNQVSCGAHRSEQSLQISPTWEK